MKAIDWLKGKKTYFVGLAVAGFGLYNHFWGDHLSWTQTIEFVFGGSALMTVRAALAKVGIESAPSK